MLQYSLISWIEWFQTRSYGCPSASTALRLVWSARSSRASDVAHPWCELAAHRLRLRARLAKCFREER